MGLSDESAIRLQPSDDINPGDDLRERVAPASNLVCAACEDGITDQSCQCATEHAVGIRGAGEMRRYRTRAGKLSRARRAAAASVRR